MLEQRLKALGIQLPAVNPPIASYVPAVRDGNLVLTSGQLPMKDGTLLITGPMSPGRSIDEAQAAMRQCFLNALAAARHAAGTDPVRVLRLGAFVASTPDFTEQHKVANGASDLAREIFGDLGVHARSAVGVPSLPLGATVELEVTFTLS